MTKVVITMPAYHAADTLERTVADIPVGIADELILVDDASGDERSAIPSDDHAVMPLCMSSTAPAAVVGMYQIACMMIEKASASA